MYLKTIITIIFAAIITLSYTQHLEGIVYHFEEHQDDEHGHEAHDHQEPLPGANVYWAGTTTGTSTNADGEFHLAFPEKEEPILVVSYIGFTNDSVYINHGQHEIEIILSVNNTLKEVVITNKASGTFISRLDPIYTQNITGAELHKAACCNLSESFETNASVNVSYSDAVTGAKQIQLLGLSGTYSQLMTENIPNLRGLATSFGLGYIPGTWMESIQISKGTSTVINGFEAIAGQINVEYLKPDNADKLFLNAYANIHGKIEGNAISAIKINDKWSTAIFAHAENLSNKVDDNDDSFLDMPLIRQFNVFNRWKYDNHDNVISQFGFKVLDEDRTGGQKDFSTDMVRDTSNPYGINIKTRRYEAFWKGGYIFENRPATSIALIQSFTHHKQNSYYGLNNYDAKENSYYLNLLFQSYIGNTRHSFTTGLSFELNNYFENLNDSAFTRFERVPGIYFQYTYKLDEKLSIIAGIRGDYHNIYGAFATPRFHLKYSITDHTILRASAGLGYRTANVIAENNTMLASSRSLYITEDPKQEKAFNAGISITQYVDILGRELRLSAEVYHTSFINQVILDFDRDPQAIYVYNLNGKSYSNAYQVEAGYELIERLDVTLAFRYNDVKMTTNDKLQDKALLHRYKGLITLSYATNLNKWQFDFTTQFNGTSRIPGTESNPPEYQRSNSSPAYTNINAQVTKYFKKWSIYLGGENLTNYKQKDPILAADQPFGKYFDSSMIWGPVSGVNIYAGLRFTL
ncbi:MAG: TonB-dependent receptor [Bacteroidales bacterium]|nr:TonB-dependent receptor [Bacteroidales bacterium]